MDHTDCLFCLWLLWPSLMFVKFIHTIPDGCIDSLFPPVTV